MNTINLTIFLILLILGSFALYHILKYVKEEEIVDNKNRVIEIKCPSSIEFFRNDYDVRNKKMLANNCFQHFNINSFIDLCNFCDEHKTDTLVYQHHLKCKEWIN